MAGLLPEALAERPGLAPRLWSAGRGLPAVEPVPYAEIGDGGPGLRRCLEQLKRDGFVVVEGAPTDEASARRLFGNFGYIREIGGASCRERVCANVLHTVVAGILKKEKKRQV